MFPNWSEADFQTLQMFNLNGGKIKNRKTRSQKSELHAISILLFFITERPNEESSNSGKIKYAH